MKYKFIYYVLSPNSMELAFFGGFLISVIGNRERYEVGVYGIKGLVRMPACKFCVTLKACLNID